MQPQKIGHANSNSRLSIHLAARPQAVCNGYRPRSRQNPPTNLLGRNKIVSASVVLLSVPRAGESKELADERLARFEQCVVPHLAAAYNLARWLTQSPHDAEDVVQEAYMRAYQFFDSFHGGDGRAWVLRIVRNTCYTWLEKNRPLQTLTTFDETKHAALTQIASPDASLLATEEKELLRQALAELPVDYREVIILRELEGMSYREIAAVISAPIAPVLSRRARARERLHGCLAKQTPEER